MSTYDLTTRFGLDLTNRKSVRIQVARGSFAPVFSELFPMLTALTMAASDINSLLNEQHDLGFLNVDSTGPPGLKEHSITLSKPEQGHGWTWDGHPWRGPGALSGRRCSCSSRRPSVVRMPAATPPRGPAGPMVLGGSAYDAPPDPTRIGAGRPWPASSDLALRWESPSLMPEHRLPDRHPQPSTFM